MEWFEQLPDMCPPKDAEYPFNRTFYRITKSAPPVNSDFFSQRMVFPQKSFNASECIAKAVSLFNNKEEAIRLAKMPTFKGGNTIAEVKLKNNDGVIKKTGKNDSHYSWWRSKNFDFTTNINIV